MTRLSTGRSSGLMIGLLYAATGRLLNAIDRIDFSPIRHFAPNMLISLDNDNFGCYDFESND